MELPFVTNNIHFGKEITGGGQEAYDLAEIVSGSWINFARKGDPNVSGMPQWPTYNIDIGATMIINKVSMVGYHHDKKLLEIAAPDLK